MKELHISPHCARLRSDSFSHIFMTENGLQFSQGGFRFSRAWLRGGYAVVTRWLRGEGMKLTEAAVRRLEPKAKQYFVFDAALPSFGVRVGPSGTLSYVLRYRVGGGRKGRQRRITIGKCATMRVDEARDIARKHLLDIRQGGDPHGERLAYRDAPTCDDLFRRFMSEHVRPRRAENTAADYQRLIERLILPALGRLKVKDVTTDDMAALHRQLRDTPAQANRVLAVASKAFSMAELWRLRPQSSNPCRLVEKYPESARDRYFSDEEMALIGNALGELEGTVNPNAVLAIRIAALTGLRIGEVLSLKWEHVDLGSGIVALPMTKTGARTLTFPAPVMALLANAERVGDFVIFGRYPNKPLNYRAVHKVWKCVRERAGVTNARIHDLRHTVATKAAASGVGAHVVRDLLGHKTLAMANLYVGRIGKTVDEVRENVSAAINATLTGKSSGKVVAMKATDR
ncbi:MAG: tyrosine-type recombinase/integrase [Paracoccaceae bacterium]